MPYEVITMFTETTQKHTIPTFLRVCRPFVRNHEQTVFRNAVETVWKLTLVTVITVFLETPK